MKISALGLPGYEYKSGSGKIKPPCAEGFWGAPRGVGGKWCQVMGPFHNVMRNFN